MNLSVRDAVAGDADAVARLVADLGYRITAGAAAGRIAGFAADTASRLLVAELDGHGVVGLIGTHLVPRLDDDASSLRITDIVVATAHRRAGIASALLAAAEQEARTAGTSRLDLTSGDWRTEAHAFYARHGFETRARAFTKRLPPAS